MAQSALFQRLRAFVGRRVRYRLTGGGFLFFLLLGLVGTVSFLTANNLLFLIFSAMLATFLVSGFLSRLMLSGLELELLLPEHVWARTAAPARVRIRNLRRFTPSFALELTGRRNVLTDAPPILTAPVYIPLIPGRTTVEAPIQVTFPHRGRHKENVFLIATRFPFGFLRKSTTLALERETIVYPALEHFEGVEQLLDRVRLNETEAALRGTGRDFYRIRPYEHGDSARHMDWKSSARTGVAHVREFAREDQSTADILIDRRVDPGQTKLFELAVERCAFLVSQLGASGTEMSFNTQGFSYVSPDEGEFYGILRYLALAEPLIAVTSIPFRESSFVASGGVQVVFSPRPGEFRERGWGGAFFVDHNQVDHNQPAAKL